MREALVESYLIARVEETGGIARKVQWIGRRGAPDRLVGWQGEGEGSAHPPAHFLIELKKPLLGPKAEAHQRREHDRLRAIGFDVRIIATKDEVDAFIKEQTGQ